MTKPIAFIAPYKKLADLFVEVADEMNKDVEVFIGDLQEGVNIAKDLEDKGYEVVISRGGTALAINDHTSNLSVVEVVVNGFDLIRVLNEARQYSGKIAIVGFRQFTYGLEDLDYIMDIDIKVITLGEGSYNNFDYIEKLLIKTKEEGYNCLVGDNISIKIASKLGMNHYLIRSGKSSLAQAILEAERILRIKNEEMEKTQRIKGIIDSVNDGIISLDKNGTIQIFNSRAEEILGYKAEDVLGVNLSKVIPQINYQKVLANDSIEVDKFYRLNNIELLVNIISIKIKGISAGLVITFQKAANIQKKEKTIRKELFLKGYTADKSFDNIIGESQAIQNAIKEAKKYARENLPLLIYGETGTGKELFAQAVHNFSLKSREPFVAFNCAAVPEELLESELFGYVGGAFTGASKKGKTGLFEQAHGGTLFLDEIGEVSLSTQAKLLRVFEERKIRKIGDDRLTPVDVRLILATNKSLSELVKEGRFREDLYYRINVLRLNLPALRDRESDIPLLVKYFIDNSNKKTNRSIRGISTKGMELLKKLNWPGNIRQLENTIERLCVKTENAYISEKLINETIQDLNEKINLNIFHENKIPNKSLEELEKEIIKKVLDEEGGNKSSAAQRLKIGRTTLWRKLNK